MTPHETPLLTNKQWAFLNRLPELQAYPEIRSRLELLASGEHVVIPAPAPPREAAPAWTKDELPAQPVSWLSGQPEHYVEGPDGKPHRVYLPAEDRRYAIPRWRIARFVDAWKSGVMDATTAMGHISDVAIAAAGKP